MELIKGCIFFMLLLVAAYRDIRTREVENYIPMMIAITALIGITVTQLPLMLLGTLIVTLPQLIIAIFKPNSVGGADIKVSAACSFLLGFEEGILWVLLGLAISLICTYIVSKIRTSNINSALTLVPYLSIGCYIAYLL